MRRNRLLMLVGAFALMLAPLLANGSVIAQDDDPIVIGAPVNLTGWMAAYDQPPLDGAKLAVEKINDAGGVLGRPLEIIEIDGKTDPATVGNAALEVIDDGADVHRGAVRLRLWRAGISGRAGSRPGRRLVLRLVAALRLGDAWRQAIHRLDVEPDDGGCGGRVWYQRQGLDDRGHDRRPGHGVHAVAGRLLRRNAGSISVAKSSARIPIS